MVEGGVGGWELYGAVRVFLVLVDEDFVHLLVEFNTEFLIAPQVPVTEHKQHISILVTYHLIIHILTHRLNLRVHQPQGILTWGVSGNYKLNLRGLLI